MQKVDSQTLDMVDNNIKVIEENFPEAITDGKVDFDKLQNLLGKYVDNNNEKYQFTWNGKTEAIKISQTSSTGTLIPCKEKSVNWDKTENLYIEGDNLEVLKLLQKSYNKKIKMIYIDPPYNTGNDLVYKDDFKDTIDNYKNQTNQDNKSNPETSGRYHTDWLNMMYPRLRLAKNLLTDDGVIFISIDDNEQSNLKKMCDEIFGETNFITQFIWKKTENIKMDSKYVSINKDYILCYQKGGLNEFSKILSTEDRYNLQDEKGKYYLRRLDGKNGYTRGLDYVITYNDKNYYASGSKEAWEKRQKNGGSSKDPRWLWSYKKYLEGLANNDIVFKGDYVYNKVRYDGIAKKPYTDFIDSVSGQTAQKELNKLFEEKRIFDHPKPHQVIKKLMMMTNNNNNTDYTVLDFFSGGATTAHAAMELNNEENGKIKYIMIQLPELCDEQTEAFHEGYKNICEIGEERIRRAGKKIVEEAGLLLEDLDTGFKVFKLETSNIKKWNNNIKDENDLFSQLEKQVNPIEDGRTELDVLYEILLKEGIELTSPVEEKTINGKIVYSVGMGYMIVALNDDIDLELVKAIGDLEPERVIFKDAGFKDENLKINAIQELKKPRNGHIIEEDNVKSL